LLLACECDARGRAGFEDRPYPQRERLTQARELAAQVDTAAIASEAAARGLKGPAIGDAITKARIMALAPLGNDQDDESAP
jgi:tRNA nucleotidyltransferase (CCA-adding enzyme)